jgi:ABC-type multidrug transport system ATPase subunit
MIEARGLTKSFGQRLALAAVTLDIARGEALAIVGPDARGRATLFRLLATVLEPTSGSLRIAELDAVKNVFAVRARLARADTDSLRAAASLRGSEYLEWLARTRIPIRRGQPNARLATALTRIDASAKRRVSTLSPSEQATLAIAAALMVAPSVLLLENPFDALDDAARGRVADWLGEAQRSGTTLVVSAADTDGVSYDHVVHVESGRAVARERPPVSERSTCAG